MQIVDEQEGQIEPLDSLQNLYQRMQEIGARMQVNDQAMQSASRWVQDFDTAISAKPSTWG